MFHLNKNLRVVNQTVYLYRTIKEIWALTNSTAGQLYILKQNTWVNSDLN